MDYENLVQVAKEEISEFHSAYSEAIQKDDIDENSGVHTIFSMVFVPLFRKALDSGNDSLVQRMALFVEEMETSQDVHVQEVAGFTVLEELCDEYDAATLESVMLDNTKNTLRDIRKYIIG